VAAADPTVNVAAQIRSAVKREHARMLDNAYTGQESIGSLVYMDADHMLEQVHRSVTPQAAQQFHAQAEPATITTAEPEATTTKEARIDWLQQLVLGDGSDGEDNDTVRNEAAKVIFDALKDLSTEVQNERLDFITGTLRELTHSDVNQANIVQTSTTMTSVKKRPAEPSHSIFGARLVRPCRR
jgi:hypothetical protein